MATPMGNPGSPHPSTPAATREARALGCARPVLETGIRQPEAIALYERAGFSRIPAFGEYVHSPLSVCMGKDLGV